MMITDISEIQYWLNIASQTESLDVESEEDWESWVTRPCIEYPLAPRQARAILEIFGFFARYGFSSAALLFRLVSYYRKQL